MDQGVVIKITLQPRLELLPAFTRHGKKYRAMTYTPDFYVEYADGRKIYIDAKGFGTQQGELRRKLYFYSYDTPLVWVSKSKKYGDSYGWIEYDELQKKRKEAKRK